MKQLLTLTFISLVALTGCLDLGKEVSEAESSTSEVSNSEKQVLNFNVSRQIDISGIVEKYPDLQKLIVESEGITGVALSADEAKSMTSVKLGAPGLKGEYTYTVILENGSVVQGRL